MESGFDKVERDPSMDLVGVKEAVNNGTDVAEKALNQDDVLLGLMNTSSPETKAAEPSQENVAAEKAPEEEEHLTELQKAMRARQKYGSGMEVDPKLQKEEPRVLRNIHDSDENREAFKSTFAEQEDMIEKAKKVVCYNRPENEIQRAELMDELSATEIGDDGIAIVPEGAKYIMARTPDVEAQIKRIKEKEAAGESVDGETTYTDVDGYVKQAQKDNIVKILIDKTGLGANITFDDEENKIIQESEMIHLIEVEDQELTTVAFDSAPDDQPFLQAIDTYQLSVSKVPMTFVASGFKADMSGMSFGEFIDITLDTSDESEDYLSFEKVNRRLSVIYNKMINISIGKFKNYKDFLQNFAYVDVQSAIYGLLIATQPEIDEIHLKCNGADCNRGFIHKYSPRGLIDFNTASTYYLKRMEEINTIPPADRLKYAINSPVRKGKRVKLPRSGYYVDLVMISCYDYLYGMLPYVNELTAEGEENPENEKKWSVIPMLNVVKAVIIPQKDGRNIRFTKMDQIVDIITTTLPPMDMKILDAAYKKFLGQFFVNYSLKDVKCPHCGRITKAISLTPDELVFQISQRQEDTSMTFDNFPDF